MHNTVMVTRFVHFDVRFTLKCCLMLTAAFWSIGQSLAQDLLGLTVSGSALLALQGSDKNQSALEPGFESLFNGKDLTGWGLRRTTDEQLASRKGWQDKDRNAPPWPIVSEDIGFDGKAASDDGRFVAKDGSLVVTTPAEGRKIQMLYTKREFARDFVLKLEFRAAPNADSGVFIRGLQLQCRDFLEAGPYKNLKKFKPQDWNELVVTVKGRIAHCTCNGEVLEAELKIPATGPIGVEGDRGQLEYRNIRIKEEPASLLKPTADVASWRLETTQKGKGTMVSKDDAIVFETTTLGDENWHVQAYQIDLDLKEGAQYTVAFQLRSPERSSVLLMGLINQEDWHEIGLHEEINGTPDFVSHQFTFTATGVVPKNNRIGFVLGVDKGTVLIKDLTLTPLRQ